MEAGSYSDTATQCTCEAQHNLIPYVTAGPQTKCLLQGTCRSTHCRQSPAARAMAATMLLLPTPGLPSSSTALGSCSALRMRIALRAAVGALNSKAGPLGTAEGLTGVRSIKNGAMPHLPSGIIVSVPAIVLSLHLRGHPSRQFQNESGRMQVHGIQALSKLATHVKFLQ